MNTDTNIQPTADNIDIYALWVKLGSYAEVGRHLDMSRQAVQYHIERVKAKQDGKSLVEVARNAIIDNALPEAVAVYDKAMRNYDTKPDLAVNVATNVLKGTQVLIPKTMEDKTTKRLELIVKAEATSNKLELVDLLNLDEVEIVETTDPPPGGSDTTDRYSNDS